MSCDNFIEINEEVWRCELCKMHYPAEGHEYFGINVHQKNKLICADCYYRLRRVIEVQEERK